MLRLVIFYNRLNVYVSVKAGGMRITQRHSGPREPCNVVPDDENNAALKVSTRFGFINLSLKKLRMVI